MTNEPMTESDEEPDDDSRQRRINNFLMLARNAQAAREQREREERERLEQERSAWDDTIATVQSHLQEYDYDR